MCCGQFTFEFYFPFVVYGSESVVGLRFQHESYTVQYWSTPPALKPSGVTVIVAIVMERLNTEGHPCLLIVRLDWSIFYLFFYFFNITLTNPGPRAKLHVTRIQKKLQLKHDICIYTNILYRSVISQDFSLFVGMWRVCKSSKMKHPGGSGGYVLWTKGRPRPATHFSNQTPDYSINYLEYF